ncbi:hypothetical protein HNV08_13760 [Winogradskyella eckloniae]|uniref:hypothetical protein n=1 Tax=Winogradskyella eckloniae TaxID=1089306 RepID=UPI0015679DD3|nr:hypothetical protein [Winogradskyella eckloniae]NRD21119.1 hypothetical protein [Winogradskyella eckloniae]
MNDSTELLFYIGPIIGSISAVLILVASIVLFVKKRTLATSIILVGNLLSCLSFIGGILLNAILSNKPMETMLLIQATTSIVQSISYLIFAIGLTMFAFTEFSKNKN